jgi:hypothetical protein
MPLSVCEFRRSTGKSFLWAYMKLHLRVYCETVISKVKDAFVKCGVSRQVHMHELLPCVLFLSTVHAAVPNEHRTLLLGFECDVSL